MSAWNRVTHVAQANQGKYKPQVCGENSPVSPQKTARLQKKGYGLNQMVKKDSLKNKSVPPSEDQDHWELGDGFTY